MDTNPLERLDSGCGFSRQDFLSVPAACSVQSLSAAQKTLMHPPCGIQLVALLAPGAAPATPAAAPPLADYAGTCPGTEPYGLDVVAGAGLFALVVDEVKHSLQLTVRDGFVARLDDRILFTRDASGRVCGCALRGVPPRCAMGRPMIGSSSVGSGITADADRHLGHRLLRLLVAPLPELPDPRGASRLDDSSVLGHGGQTTHRLPPHELVVVFTGGDCNSGASPPNGIMAMLILPALLPAQAPAAKEKR